MTYQRFNIGNIGAGGINLIDGSTTLALDVIPNSKDLLVDVSFVYNSNETSTKYGKGFTLNINDEANNTQHFAKVGDNITEIFGKNGKKIVLSYNSGKLANIKDFDGKSTLFNYDGNNLASITLPNSNGKTSFVYQDNVIYQITPPIGAGIIIGSSNNSISLSEFLIITEGNTHSISLPKVKVKIERIKQSEKLYGATVHDLDKNIKLDKTFHEYSKENYFRQEKLFMDGDLKQVSTQYLSENYTFDCAQNDLSKVLKESDFKTTPSATQVQDLLNATKGQWVLTVFIVEDNKVKPLMRFHNPITKGNIVKTIKIHYSHFTDGNLKSELQQVYLNGTLDKNLSTQYLYYPNTDKVSKITDPFGMITEFAYDGYGDVETIKRYHTSDPSKAIIIDGLNEFEEPTGTNYVSKVLEKRLLKRLTSGTTQVDYTYDEWLREASVSLNNNIHVEHEYGLNDITSTYANGDAFKAMFDKLGRPVSVKRGEKELVRNIYDGKGKLTHVSDMHAGNTTQFIYDGDELTKIKQGDVTITPKTDIHGNLSELTYQIGNRNPQIYDFYTSNPYYTFERTNSLNGSNIEHIELDHFGRVKLQTNPVVASTYEYHTKPVRTLTSQTGLVKKISNHLGTTEYAYQDENISQVKFNNNITSTYQYDEFGRLIKDNATTYTYDTNGNIKTKGSIKYEYNGNRLTKFGNEEFAYDEMGNPLIYRNKNLKWDFRDLKQYDRTGFNYDASGLRTHKTRGKQVTKYYWAGNTLIGEKRTTSHSDFKLGDTLPQGGIVLRENHEYIEYIYGESGILGFTLQRDKGIKQYYWYHKNLQGDVIAIYNDAITKNKVATYEYDAWGNHTVINHTSENIGDLNPIRYRSYYYDVETKLYYLKSRYYDSEVGRFISPDKINHIHADIVNGLNLYIYCGNNPIMNIDPTGECWWCRRWGDIKDAVKAVGNVIGSGIELIGTTINEIPSFLNALVGSGVNLLTGSNYYSISDWQMGGGQRVNNALKNFGNSFIGRYDTEVWSNMANGFWNTINWLRNNFYFTLFFLSLTLIAGPGWLLAATIAASIIMVLYDFNPKK